MNGIDKNLQSFLKTHYEHPIIQVISKQISNEKNFLLLHRLSQLDPIKNNNPYDIVISAILLNELGDINRNLARINHLLNNGGKFIGKAETLGNRRYTMIKSYGVLIYSVVKILEFIFKRTLPKLPVFRTIYRKLGIIKHHVMSKCEILGRLCYNGFEILEVMETNRFLYFITCKKGEPLNEPPYDGILIKVPKIGKNGRTIYCYKLRTMHAYAKYLHNYILKTHGTDNEGKIVDDFRVTQWGKFLRKMWLDELPQIINIIKGDMTLVGFRPLSKEFLSLYPEKWRDERLKMKPGFIPIYYADCPKTFDEIIASEQKYINLKRRYPFTADIYCVGKVIVNFLLRRVRTG